MVFGPRVLLEFLIPEFLDYTGNQPDVETKLAERVLIHINMIWDALGFPPTVHFGTGLRLGIHTILDINSHIYKIGHSGT